MEKLALEITYNALKPFHWALGLYALAVMMGLIALIRPAPWASALASLSISAGALLHIGGIAARIYVLDRPPVGTLYESLIFVALICAGVGAWSSLRSRSRSMITLVSSAIAACLLLGIAPYLLSEGEGMDMLVAVLNTNFWLTTHVLCITAGYAVSILAAGFAHAYLIMRLIGRDPKALRALLGLMHRTAIVALLLTAVGTALGGIWADQSWGRFWGWDPKENGALLIVLWLVWALHGKMSGHMKPVFFAAVIGYLNVIVALAWFGVNLLNVGLHSYGFIDGIALGLGSFCAFETLLLGGLWLGIHLKDRRDKAYVA